MKNRIYLSPPHLDGLELEYVKNVFKSNWIAPIGPDLDLFENELANYTERKHCSAHTTGTACIHLALLILGVKQDDEVLCQSLTFIGSVNPILYQKATPIFIDSEPDTWNMCPDALEMAIKDRIQKTGKVPKAIIPVHLYGMPAKIDRIIKIAQEYEIPIIEDAAEALGSNIEGIKSGNFGDISILSFNGNKIITTSGGGALLSNNAEWIDKAKFLSTQARDVAPHYQHSVVGYNYRLSNVLAGIGRGQMKVLDDRVKARRENNQWYRTIFKDNVSFQNEPDGYYSNYWLTSVLFNNKQENKRLMNLFEQQNIESRPLWKPMHLQPIFNGSNYYGENNIAEKMFQVGLCLPSGSNLSFEDKNRIEKVMYNFNLG